MACMFWASLACGNFYLMRVAPLANHYGCPRQMPGAISKEGGLKRCDTLPDRISFSDKSSNE
jgi:hypothetical protein